MSNRNVRNFSEISELLDDMLTVTAVDETVRDEALLKSILRLIASDKKPVSADVVRLAVDNLKAEADKQMAIFNREIPDIVDSRFGAGVSSSLENTALIITKELFPLSFSSGSTLAGNLQYRNIEHRINGKTLTIPAFYVLLRGITYSITETNIDLTSQWTRLQSTPSLHLYIKLNKSNNTGIVEYNASVINEEYYNNIYFGKITLGSDSITKCELIPFIMLDDQRIDERSASGESIKVLRSSNAYLTGPLSG